MESSGALTKEIYLALEYAYETGFQSVYDNTICFKDVLDYWFGTMSEFEEVEEDDEQ